MKTIPAFLQDKLDALQENDEAVTAWARSAIAKAEALRMRVGQLRAEKASAESRAGETSHYLAEIERLEAKAEAAVIEHTRRREWAITANQSLTTARDFLAQLPDSARLAPAPPVKICNGDHRRTLDVVRQTIAALQTELAQLRQRPVERAEIALAVGAEVTRRAAAVPRWTSQRGLGDMNPGSAFATLCALFPAELTQVLTDGYVDQFSRSGLAPIGSPERSQAIAAIEARLLNLGYQEEALIAALLDQNGPTSVARRREADPRCILGVVVGGAAAPQLPPPAPEFEATQQAAA